MANKGNTREHSLTHSGREFKTVSIVPTLSAQHTHKTIMGDSYMCRYSWVQKSFVRSSCLYTGSHSLLYHPIIPYSGFQFAHKLKLKGVNVDYRLNPTNYHDIGRLGYMTIHRVTAPKLCGGLPSSVMVSTVDATTPPMKMTAQRVKEKS